MREKLVNVEAGRGIAALLVVLYHADKYYFSTDKYWQGDALGGLFKFGHAGVEFFFVLSGYIMYAVHRRDVGYPDKLLPFLQKRFVRIYPFFWLILAVTVVGYFLAPGTGEAEYRDPRTIVESALLVGREPLDAAVFVSWTLWHEALFYAFCALVIAAPKLGAPAFLAWIAACAVITPLGVQVPWPAYWTGFVNVLFGFGVAASAYLARFKVPAPRFVLVAGVALFLGTGLVANATNIDLSVSNVFFGLGSMLALLGAVEAERSQGLRAPRWMVLLGAASFAVYLVHMPALTVLAKVSAKVGLPRMISEPAAYVGLVLGATLTGVLAHLLVERHVVRLARRLVQGRAAVGE